jgi:uncharacterized protein YuzE
MRFDSEPERNYAYLSLDDAPVVTRLAFTDEDFREAWGINLHFDEPGHLVGIEFEEAERQVPARLLAHGEGLRVEHDPATRAAYLYLQPIGKGGVAETLAFGEEENRPAWGINLDFDKAGRLIGVEFESDRDAPPSLLTQATRI